MCVCVCIRNSYRQNERIFRLADIKIKLTSPSNIPLFEEMATLVTIIYLQRGVSYDDMTGYAVTEDLKYGLKHGETRLKLSILRTLSFTEISQKHTARTSSDKGRLIRATTDVVLSTNCVISLAEYKGDSGKEILTKESHQSDFTVSK